MDDITRIFQGYFTENGDIIRTPTASEASPKDMGMVHAIDGLVQERRNSSALSMELRLSCTNSLIYHMNSLETII